VLKRSRSRPSAGRSPVTGTAPVLRLRAALPVAAGSGLLTYLAFPGHDLWALAPVGLGALVVATAGRRAASAALVGLVAGLALCLPLLSWAGVYVGLIAWLPLSLACALFTAVAGVLLAAISRLPGGAVLRAVCAAGAWVALEGLLARFPFGGFGWPRVAFSQADAPTLGLAAVGGAPLVSFAVATTGALLAAALLRALGAGPPGPRGTASGRRRRWVALPLLAAALATEGAGALVPRPTAPQVGTLQVAAVQGNVPRAGLDFNAQRRAVLDDHARETAALVDQVAAGRRPAPDLVVWPENSSDIDPFRNPDAYDEVQQATTAVKAPLLMGAVLQGRTGLRNTSLLWEPGVGPVASYDKRHPVPFAEYIPHRAFFRRITSAVDLVRADFVPGHRVGRIDAAGARLGVMICFEVVDDGLVSDTVDEGADLLVVQTNNATFGYTDESVQQLAMSRLRAVEHGRAVVHVSTVGRSALVEPDGTLLQETDLFTAAVLEHRLPLRTSATVADRLRRAGVPVEGVLAGLGLLGAAGGVLAARRR
jgi:apolipoprotein N-acyltransferase